MQNYLGDNLDSLAAGITGLMANDANNSNSASSNNSSSNGVCGRSKDRDFVFCSFNQDNTSLAVGTIHGYKLFSLNSSDRLDCIYENDSEEVVLAERLFSSSLVAVVSKSAPRKLRVCHFKKGTEICNYSYSSRILSVKMNRARLVVCLEESLYVHNIRDMKVIHTIKETPPNPTGLCALSPGGCGSGDATDGAAAADGRNYLAYPGSSSVGEILIFDTVNLSSKGMISAHATQLAALSFSPSGSRIASASEKGTVIRVFSTADGCRLYELRRGLKRTANIYSLSFSPCGHYLACSSNTETVHVFRLSDDLELPKPRGDSTSSSALSQSPSSLGTSPPSASSVASSAGASTASGAADSLGWLGYLNTMVTASASYLPAQVTDTLMQGRAFATVHHSQPGMRNICALAMIKRCLRLVVTSQDGYLYLYSLNLEEGGDCSLMRQFQLMEHDSSGGGKDAVRRRPSADATGGGGGGGTSSGGGSGSSSEGEDASPPAEGEVSYADRVKNRANPSEMTDSEKFHEMSAATEVPPQQCFLLDDDGEFPPMVPGKAN